MPWWITIEREHGAPLRVGPYADEAAARLAMYDALLIQDLCEEDSIDAWMDVWGPDALMGAEYPPGEVYLIDPTDPDHMGFPEEKDGWS